MLNSRNVRVRGLKQALNPSNINEVKSLVAEARQYLLNLKCSDGKSILISRRKLGFIGFLLSMNSAIGVYEMYVSEKKSLQNFPTYKISQDHLERLFSYIRARGGHNNNPSCKEFIYSFRAILVHKELHENSASSSNAIPLDKINILGVGLQATSCPVENINMTNLRRRLLDDDAPELKRLDLNPPVAEHEDMDIPSEMLELSEIATYIDVEETPISMVSRDIIEYLAGFIVRKLNLLLNCDGCLQAVESNVHLREKGLIAMKDRGGLVLPSKSVIEICQISEKIYRCKKKGMNPLTDSESCVSTLLKHCVRKNFFAGNEHFAEDEEHYASLIKAIGKLFFKTRIHHEIKIVNDSLHKEKIRTKNNKVVLFKGQ